MKLKIVHIVCLALSATLMFSALAIAGSAVTRGAAKESEQQSKESAEIGSAAPLREEPERPGAVVAGYIDPIPAHPDRKYYDVKLSIAEQNTVFDYCEMYDVPAELVFGIMSVESEFVSSSLSSTLDYGIMQINSSNHKWLSEELGVTDFFDYEQNVLCGVYMLSEYYHKYADVEKIAMCYHYGESGAVDLWEKGITSSDYTSAVVQAIAQLKVRSDG